jgi:hypothetical protein
MMMMKKQFSPNGFGVAHLLYVYGEIDILAVPIIGENQLRLFTSNDDNLCFGVFFTHESHCMPSW